MKVEVIMPKMGESLQEGTITKWLKKVGETVERDEMILEISTDKVDTEVPSPVSGILSEILSGENVTVEVGKVIAYIETEATAAVSVQSPEPQPAIVVQEEKKETVRSEPVQTGGELVDVIMPKMGESLQEGTITKWLKKVGETVERDEMILEISTDKVDTEVPSPVAGILAEIIVNANETVEVGKVIAKISTGGVASAVQIKKELAPAPSIAASAPVQQVSAPQQQTTVPEGMTEIPREFGGKFFSPLVRSIAETEKVSLQELVNITGSGSEGRITKTDIMAYVEKRKSQPTVVPEAPKAVSSAPAPSAPVMAPPVFGSDVEIIPMDRMRQLIAEHMTYSKQTSAHVTSVAEADVTGIVKMRNKFKDSFEKREGFKLTFTPFFAKAAIDGIKQFPRVNVSVDGKNIIQHKRIHLSFATALDDGNLIVPVIKSADALGFTGLARSVYDLSTRARTKKLNPDDIQGGTFTITNVGTFGTLFGTPVINQPQTAIMGIGAIKKRPVVKEFNGEDLIVVRDMAYVSITYDHRVIDGMLAGQCLAAIVKALESMNDTNIDL